MVQQDTFIQQEQELLNKLKQLKPPKPLKRRSKFDETIAVTKNEVTAILQAQREQRLLRLLEIEDILLREIERCRKLTQQKQD